MADIQTLINAIPDAQDGNVITSDYHNTIKTALEAIAGQLGPGAGGQTVTLTLIPSFLVIPGDSAWNVNVGAASDAGGLLTDGWIPLYLPDGAVIQQLVVIGLKTIPTTPAQFQANVQLLVMSVGSTKSLPLISVDLTNMMGNPFTTPPGIPSFPGSTPSSLKDVQTVKNDQNKYAIYAKANPSPAGGGTLTIEAIQVSYTTPQ